MLSLQTWMRALHRNGHLLLLAIHIYASIAVVANWRCAQATQDGPELLFVQIAVVYSLTQLCGSTWARAIYALRCQITNAYTIGTNVYRNYCSWRVQYLLNRCCSLAKACAMARMPISTKMSSGAYSDL